MYGNANYNIYSYAQVDYLLYNTLKTGLLREVAKT